MQLTAAGTLPVDVYFQTGVVYRIEIRAGNTQADALIWLIESYTPSEGSGSNITTASLASDNQITNPQFSLVNFATSLDITSAGTYSVAPGWDLVLEGSGTAVVTREALTSSSANETNAPYVLRLDILGWTNRYLRQRFNQNGMLWAGLYISTSITAKVDATNANISATLVDSNGTDLAIVLESAQLTASYAEYTYVTPNVLPATTNPDTPPAAYIEYRLALPSSIDVSLSSVQVVASSDDLEFTYEQDTIDRQIDHTYHLAYPIVPIGTIIDYAGFTPPAHYLLCDGGAYNRITYKLLFNILTTTEDVSLTNTVATFTVVSSDNYHIGMAIEGDGIPAATTISNISGATITMSAAATATATSTVRFFAWGAGDGSTTFNTPDLREYVTAGANGSLFGTGLNAVGYKGGASTLALSSSNLPPHTHTYTHYTTNNFGSAGGTSFFITNGTSNTSDGGFANTPISLVQKTANVFKYIRYE